MTAENQNVTMYRGETKDVLITVYDDVGNYANLAGATIQWDLVNRNTGEILVTKTTASGISITDPANGGMSVSLLPIDTSSLEPANWYYHMVTVLDNTGYISVSTTGNFQIKYYRTSNLGYLIPALRLTIGDTDPSAYRYLDEWLHVALLTSVKALQAWWLDKYLIDDDNNVYRNTETGIPFEFNEPPIIMQRDERPIELMAAILILTGSLENSAWSTYSWRDAEIAFSNLEGGRMRDSNLKRLWEELNYLIKPATKRLARAQKGSLPGYLGNDWEIGKLK